MIQTNQLLILENCIFVKQNACAEKKKKRPNRTKYGKIKNFSKASIMCKKIFRKNIADISLL